jgi:Holliday junction resolvase RusA-like endonuclease
MIALPMPPSANRIWAHGKGRTFKSERYKIWQRAADNEFLQHRKEWAPVKGHFRALITLNAKRRKGDADNRIKATLDFCQRVGLIENDSLCDGVTAEWGFAPEGCRVHIFPSSLPVTAPGRPEGQQRADGTYPAKVAA